MKKGKKFIGIIVFIAFVIGIKIYTSEAANLKLSSFTTSIKSYTYTNQNIKLSAKAYNGSGKKKYKFYYKLNGKTKTIKGYSTSSSISFKPQASGTYTLYVSVKDNKKTITKSKKISVYKAISGKMTLSTTYLDKGKTLTINASGSGGYENLKYQISYIYNKKTYNLTSYSTKKKITFKPTKTGVYTIQLKVKDGKNTVKTYKKTLYVVTPMKVSFKSNKTTQTFDKNITLTANSSGGYSTKTYRYRYKINDGKISTIKNYSSTKSLSYKVKAPGSLYTFYVDVKDKAGKVKTEKLTVKTTDIEFQFKKNEMNLEVGKTAKNTVSSKYSLTYSYSSSNKSKCLIDSKTGLMMPIASGSTTIKVKGTYGSYSRTLTFKINIKDNPNVLTGVDLSHHNTTTTIKGLKDKGIDFVILRISYSTSSVSKNAKDDKLFKTFINDCEKYGMDYGVYIYSLADSETDGKNEANKVKSMLNSVNAVPGQDHFKYPIFYDMEDDVMKKKGKATILKIFKAFVTQMNKNGYTNDNIGVYANTDWYKNYLTDKYYTNFMLWQAHYGLTGKVKGVHKEPAIWQVGSTFKVESSDVDVNYMYIEDKIPEQPDKPIIPEEPNEPITPIEPINPDEPKDHIENTDQNNEADDTESPLQEMIIQ